MEYFIKLCSMWREWEKEADRSEDGWQSSFIYWTDLMNAAKSIMLKNEATSQALNELEFCWSISEETEDLVDFAIEHAEKVWNILEKLANSKDKNVRWQIYYVFGEAGDKGESYLRDGIKDPDPYCRRRALLALAKLEPKDADQIAERFVADEDPYLRQASIEMICVSKNYNFRNQMKTYFLKDPVGHVALAAEKIIVK
jgi:hypothetical protein